jgi:hypothetical protein
MPLIVLGSNLAQDGPKYSIQRTDEPVTIDGVLSESIWSEVYVATDFWMSYPVDYRKA